MIDTGTILDQVASHLNVIIDDRFQQGSPQFFVLGIHLSTSLSIYNQIQSLFTLWLWQSPKKHQLKTKVYFCKGWVICLFFLCLTI